LAEIVKLITAFPYRVFVQLQVDAHWVVGWDKEGALQRANENVVDIIFLHNIFPLGPVVFSADDTPNETVSNVHARVGNVGPPTRYNI
jgi:hypothetical protein